MLKCIIPYFLIYNVDLEGKVLFNDVIKRFDFRRVLQYWKKIYIFTP